MAAEAVVLATRARKFTDINEAVHLVFGRLMRLAAPVIKGFESDMFYDALWLKTHLTGDSFTFFWSVGEGGTVIGTAEAVAALAWHRPDTYQMTVALDERGQVTYQAVNLAGIGKAVATTDRGR